MSVDELRSLHAALDQVMLTDFYRQSYHLDSGPVDPQHRARIDAAALAESRKLIEGLGGKMPPELG